MPTSNKSASVRRNRGRKMPRHLPLVTFVPSSRKITMTYATSAQLAESAAGSGTTYFYRLNSVYDPDASGVGTSAIGYSTWSGLFLNYKVRKVTARLQGTVFGLASGAYVNVILAPVPSQSVVPANKQTWKMIRGAVVKQATNQSNGGKNFVTMTQSYDNAWVAEISPQQYEIDMDFSGQVGSNPVRQNYLMLAIDSVGSGTVATLSYSIQITYEVEWFNPVPMQ